jgi:hypothetical protein
MKPLFFWPVLLFAAASLNGASPGCGKDADCPGELVCEKGVCVKPGAQSAPIAPAVPQGEPPAAPAPTPWIAKSAGCGKDADCPGDLVCEKGVCVKPGAKPAHLAPAAQAAVHQRPAAGPAAAARQIVKITMMDGTGVKGTLIEESLTQYIVFMAGNKITIDKNSVRIFERVTQ